MKNKGLIADKTVFGNDSQRYVAKLLGLVNVDRGQGLLIPDLASRNGSHNPALLVECKSGKNGKISLVSYQLRYSILDAEIYESFFGEPFSGDEIDLTLGRVSRFFQDFRPKDRTVYYQASIKRSAESVYLHATDFPRDIDKIKLQWGDVYITPGDMVLNQFLAAKSSRYLFAHRDFNVAQEYVDLVNRVKEDIISNSSNYSSRKSKQDWQSFSTGDLDFLIGNSSKLTKFGQRRIEVVKETYAYLDSLKKLEIKGPNGTKIYVLAKPEDYNLFDKDIRRIVRRTISELEEISQMRQRSLGLLGKAHPNVCHLFYQPDNVLSGREIALLNHLSDWEYVSQDDLDEEEALTLDDSSLKDVLNYKDDIPF